MATMDAALFDGRGRMEVHHLPTPEVGPDDALVRVEVCGICGSDFKGYKDRDEPESLPAGHEVAGETVVVLGAGKLYATARHPHQAELARRLGADDVLPTESNALRDAVDELTGGRGADVTFETVGLTRPRRCSRP